MARELNLTQEQAQKLVDVYPKVLAGVQQQQAESWQKQTEDWAAAVKADKDIGGDKLASNLGAAQRAIDTFGTKELKEYLDGTCARSSGQCCTVTEAIPPGTRYHINAFYFTGCGLQRRPALLPRDRKQHQSLRSFAYCTRPVRRFRRVKRQSDAQPLHRAMPLFSGFRRSFPNLTRLFGAAVSKKEEKRSIPRGHDARRIPAHAGSLYRVQSETPYTSTNCHPA